MRALAGSLAALALAACSSGGGLGIGGGGPDYASSGFAEAGDNGFLTGALVDQLSIRFVEADGAGFAYRAGLDAQDNYTAQSGLVGAALIDRPAASGQLRYTGSASMMIINRSDRNDSFAESEQFSSTVVVRADLDSGTFRGRTPQPQGFNPWQLTFSGQIEGNRMTGAARLTGRSFDLSGPLDGRIGSERAIAVFHGNDEEDTFAGGFSTSTD